MTYFEILKLLKTFGILILIFRKLKRSIVNIFFLSNVNIFFVKCAFQIIQDNNQHELLNFNNGGNKLFEKKKNRDYLWNSLEQK